MATIGQYANGPFYVVNPAGGGGLRIDNVIPAFDPAYVFPTGQSAPAFGMEKNMGRGEGAASVTRQGLDGRNVVGIFWSYDGARNVDLPHTLAPGEFAVFTKALSRTTWNATRPQVDKLVDFYAVPEAPPAGSISPARSATSHVPVLNTNMLSLARFQNINPAASPALLRTPATLDQMISRVQRPWSLEQTNGNFARDFAAVQNQWDAYGASVNQEVARALILLNLNYPTDAKLTLAMHLAARGLQVLERHRGGGQFANYQSPGQGGHQHYHKSLLFALWAVLDPAVAPALVAEIEDRLDGTTGARFTNDAQYFTVDETTLTIPRIPNNSRPANSPLPYAPIDLGMPEWCISGEFANNGNNGNAGRQIAVDGASPLSEYRSAVNHNMLMIAIAARLISGGEAAWGNAAFFQYIERHRWQVQNKFGDVDGYPASQNFLFRSIDRFWPASLHSNATPNVTACQRRGTWLWFVLDQNVRESGAEVATTAYTVVVNGNPQTVLQTRRSYNKIGCRIADELDAGDTVTLAYTAGTPGITTWGGATVPSISATTAVVA